MAVALGLSGCSSPSRLAFEAGRSKWDQGDVDGALAEFSRATLLDPQDPKGYRGKAAALHKKGDLGAAIEEYGHALDLDPSDADTFEARAGVRFEKGDWDGAILDYSRVLELGPKRAGVYFCRAYAKHQKGDFDGSIADLDRAIDLEPRTFKYFTNRAASKQAKSDWGGAIEDLTRSLEIAPEDGEAYDRRGQAKHSKGDVDGAIEDFSRAIDRNPNDVEAYCHRGVARSAKKDWEGAIADFTRALGLDPRNGCLYSNRGGAKLGKEDWDGAIEDFKRAIELEPRDAKSVAGLATAKISKGDWTGAIADLKHALELDAPAGNPELKKSLQGALDALKTLAARINGEELTWNSVRERLGDVKPDQITPELLHAKRRELVESILIRQFAGRKHVTVSEAEIDDAVDRNRKPYSSAEEFEKAITIGYGSHKKYRESLHWSLFRAKTLAHALSTAATDPELAGAGFSPPTCTKEELRKYFDEHRDQFEKAVEQIAFVRIGITIAGAKQEAVKREILESLLRRLEKGSEFTMLAWFYSDVPRAKGFRDRGVNRADLKGYYSPETIAYLFDTLKEGETSGIVKDGSTLNIFKMEQKLKHPAESFEDAEEKIRSTLETGVRVRNYDALVQVLRRSAKIEPADVFQEK